MAREGYRCPVTGTFNMYWVKRIRELILDADLLTYGRGLVSCCHIINESTTQNIDASVELQNEAAEETKEQKATRLQAERLHNKVRSVLVPLQ